MTKFGDASLEAMLIAMRGHIDNAAMTVAPRHLIVPQSLRKQAMRILFYRRPMRARKGARGRKYSLMWR